jgi:hypothetical protein
MCNGRIIQTWRLTRLSTSYYQIQSCPHANVQSRNRSHILEFAPLTIRFLTYFIGFERISIFILKVKLLRCQLLLLLRNCHIVILLIAIIYALSSQSWGFDRSRIMAISSFLRFRPKYDILGMFWLEARGLIGSVTQFSRIYVIIHINFCLFSFLCFLHTVHSEKVIRWVWFSRKEWVFGASTIPCSENSVWSCLTVARGSFLRFLGQKTTPGT